ncbi:hypothetical protein [Streptomyces sp. NPDC091416]|uniref:hypothetical protein n=1 Tax=Streptomyces sp. NPDC091416 TaxID=3366003 RepID=UPI00381AAE1A
MSPHLSTRHPWRLQFGEAPLPFMLAPELDVVRVSMGLGMAALDEMIDCGNRVGPLLCCIAHRRLLIPVSSGTAHVWRAAHSACEPGPSLRCSPEGPPQSLCHSRFWVAPPEALAYPTTDAVVLHGSLSLMRARMREMCHV